MKVLVTKDRIVDVGGAETWVFTIARALQVLGHNVTVATLERGLFAHEVMVRQSIRVALLEELPAFELFDVAIISQTATWPASMPLAKRKIFVCHGTIEAEQPPYDCEVAYVSEEARDAWDGNGAVITQPIEPGYGQTSPIARNLRRVLWFDRYGGIDWLEDVVLGMGYQFDHAKDELEPFHKLSMADLVVTAGRGALEAAACGKDVYIASNRPYDHRGPIADGFLAERYEQSQMCNFSGRARAIDFGADEAKRMLLKAPNEIEIRARNNRSLILSYHDSHQVARGLLELAR